MVARLSPFRCVMLFFEWVLPGLYLVAVVLPHRCCGCSCCPPLTVPILVSPPSLFFTSLQTAFYSVPTLIISLCRNTAIMSLTRKQKTGALCFPCVSSM